MITITVKNTSGSLVATASANVMTLTESGRITVINNTSSQLWVEQMLPLTWVIEAAATYSPAYENLSEVAADGQAVISNYLEPKAYLGFATGTTWPAAQDIFGQNGQNVPADDLWFFTPPPASPIVPLRISGSVDAVLTPQTDTDPNSPHSVHPVAAITVNWDPANPMLWITNNCGAAVTLYVEVFYTVASQLPPVYFAYPLPSILSGFNFPIGQTNVLKAWYGFAFPPPAPGAYANAQAYFADHPAGSDGHHTGEIPPAGT
jgi:hypothetical protein